MKSLVKAAGLAIVLILSVALVRDTYYNGWDFQVFHSAAEALLRGESPYGVGRETEGWRFKYPPWVATAFLPLGALPLGLAKALWGASQVALIAVCLRWLGSQGVAARTLWVTGLAFYPIWAYHALSGQFTLAMLGLALLIRDPRQGVAPGPWAAAIWGLSSKIFSGIALVGPAFEAVRTRQWTPLLRALAWAAVALAVLSLPVLGVHGWSPTALVASWKEAAGSGATELAAGVVRGYRNQGFPAAFLRLLGTPAGSMSWDLAAFVICGAVLGGAWWKVSRRMSWPERWSGWLALSVAAHPLAWIHSFVLAFPLIALALDKAWRGPDSRARILATSGLVATVMVTRNTAGAAGLALELASIKSWGVVLAGAGLWLAWEPFAGGEGRHAIRSEIKDRRSEIQYRSRTS